MHFVELFEGRVFTVWRKTIENKLADPIRYISCAQLLRTTLPWLASAMISIMHTLANPD